MADGVDHIDIYADVEEEFNQVLNPLSSFFDWKYNALYIYIINGSYCDRRIARRASQTSSIRVQAPFPHAASLQPPLASTNLNVALLVLFTRKREMSIESNNLSIMCSDCGEIIKQPLALFSWHIAYELRTAASGGLAKPN